MMTEGEQIHKTVVQRTERERTSKQARQREKESFDRPQHEHDTYSLNTSDELKTRITRRQEEEAADDD